MTTHLIAPSGHYKSTCFAKVPHEFTAQRGKCLILQLHFDSIITRAKYMDLVQESDLLYIRENWWKKFAKNFISVHILMRILQTDDVAL